MERKLYPQNIYTDCASLVEWMQADDLVVNWRHKEHIWKIRQLVSQCCNAQVTCISSDVNEVGDTIAKSTLKNPSVSLYHKGLEMPTWLVKAASASELKF